MNLLEAAPAVAPMPLDLLVEVLGRPLSAEQAAVVTAPLEAGVVVAGAGSGKTATMVARVVWLVGSGLVLPEQVLGLTFTTKAADELAVRVRGGLRRLRAAGLLPTPPGAAAADSPGVGAAPADGAALEPHPLGASGAKLMATLVHALRARGGRYGLQTMCEGGGIANATIIEAL